MTSEGAPRPLQWLESGHDSVFVLLITTETILVFISLLKQERVNGNCCTPVLEHISWVTQTDKRGKF